MKYRLEWNQGCFESNDWNQITLHQHFINGTTFERTQIGWCAT